MEDKDIIITSVTPFPNYVLEVTFNDGTHKKVSVKDLVENNKYFAILEIESIFNLVHIDTGKAVVWSDTLDLAATSLYHRPEIVHA